MNNFRRRVEASSGGIDPVTGRGIVDGYEVVDLGLPSGLLWATYNVGATKEEEYGNYYQWGAGAETYKNADQYHTGGTDPSYTMPSSADTARQVMGSGWRMPTYNELLELIQCTIYEFTYIDNVGGMKFTNKYNLNAYVFFPSGGNYYYGSYNSNNQNGFIWSSTPANGLNQAFALIIQRNSRTATYYYRSYGFSVRGVHAAV